MSSRSQPHGGVDLGQRPDRHADEQRPHAAVQPGLATPGWGGRSSDRVGYDGCGRMISKRYVTSGGDLVVGFTTAYDRASNKVYERALHAESRSSLYEPVNGLGQVDIS